jgi:hypothetical protein
MEISIPINCICKTTSTQISYVIGKVENQHVNPWTGKMPIITSNNNFVLEIKDGKTSITIDKKFEPTAKLLLSEITNLAQQTNTCDSFVRALCCRQEISHRGPLTIGSQMIYGNSQGINIKLDWIKKISFNIGSQSNKLPLYVTIEIHKTWLHRLYAKIKKLIGWSFYESLSVSPYGSKFGSR